MLLEHLQRGRFAICHAVAELFGVRDRGYSRESYCAGLVLVDPSRPTTIRHNDISYKFGWLPLEGYEFRCSIRATLANREVVWLGGQLSKAVTGQRLDFGYLPLNIFLTAHHDELGLLPPRFGW